MVSTSEFGSGNPDRLPVGQKSICFSILTLWIFCSKPMGGEIFNGFNML